MCVLNLLIPSSNSKHDNSNPAASAHSTNSGQFTWPLPSCSAFSREVLFDRKVLADTFLESLLTTSVFHLLLFHLTVLFHFDVIDFMYQFRVKRLNLQSGSKRVTSASAWENTNRPHAAPGFVPCPNSSRPGNKHGITLASCSGCNHCPCKKAVK